MGNHSYVSVLGDGRQVGRGGGWSNWRCLCYIFYTAEEGDVTFHSLYTLKSCFHPGLGTQVAEAEGFQVLSLPGSPSQHSRPWGYSVCRVSLGNLDSTCWLAWWATWRDLDFRGHHVWRCWQAGSAKEGRPSKNVGSTTLWAGILKKKETARRASSSLIADAVCSACILVWSSHLSSDHTFCMVMTPKMWAQVDPSLSIVQ